MTRLQTDVGDTNQFVDQQTSQELEFPEQPSVDKQFFEPVVPDEPVTPDEDAQVQQKPISTESQDSLIPKPGNLVTFFYAKRVGVEIHDPKPYVIITDWNPPTRIRGINLHYMTYNSMEDLLGSLFEGKIGPSYRYIKTNKFWTDAFRSYSFAFIKNLKKMNPEYVQEMINRIKGYDPNQEAAMREEVQRQLREGVNQPTAEEMTGTVPPTGTVLPTRAIPPVGGIAPIPAVGAPDVSMEGTQPTNE